jgi:hypothetical protein
VNAGRASRKLSKKCNQSESNIRATGDIGMQQVADELAV